MAENDPTPPPPPTPTTPEPSGRRTEADLRAELAAERVSKADVQRQLEARVSKAEADLAKAKEDVDSRVSAAETKATERLTKLQARVLDSELKAAASAAGLRDPDLLLHPLLDRSKITVSEDGEVSGVGEAFEALKGKKPEWFGSAADLTPPPSLPQRGPTGGPAPQPGGTPPPPTNVTKMTDAEYRQHKTDFRRHLRSAG